jgi:large subunit ribosomal protein L28
LCAWAAYRGSRRKTLGHDVLERRCAGAAATIRAGPLYSPSMSKVCHVCAKGPAFGHSRSHSMVATKRRFEPNLQRVRIDDGGTPRRVYVCTRCLKAGKVVKAR